MIFYPWKYIFQKIIHRMPYYLFPVVTYVMQHLLTEFILIQILKQYQSISYKTLINIFLINNGKFLLKLKIVNNLIGLDFKFQTC